MPATNTTNDALLLPRSLLFGNPQRSGAQISPDGQYLSWLAPLDGVMNVWVARRDGLDDAWPVTHDQHRGVRNFGWARDGVHLLFLQDNQGDENYHLHAVTAQNPKARNLTPFPGARAELVSLSDRSELRRTLLVSLNLRDPSNADLYHLDIDSGELTLVLENLGFAGYVTDVHLKVRLALKIQPDGSSQYLKPAAGGWHEWLAVSAEDSRTTRLSHLDAQGQILYLYDSRNRDKAALVALPFELERAHQHPAEVIAEHPYADISGMWTHSETFRPQFCSAAYERNDYLIVDEAIRADVELLNEQLPGAWSISSRSDDDRYWVVVAGTDMIPGSAYLYIRLEQRLELLYLTRPELLDTPLARMQSVVIKARDGLDLVSYLTLPLSSDEQGKLYSSTSPLPLVLLVHGGPWARDSYGFNLYHQWLANRGYAVLSVNFRGSTGFGKHFINAADREWGGKMDEDLCDAVDWAIERGIADSARVAIMGGSYGGYATLWAMTQHPERYACGVDIVGPSNLKTLLASIPAHWESIRSAFHRSVGDPRTPEGLRELDAKSPLTYAHQIRKPLLIGQGANDPRVKQAESDQMVKVLKDRGIPVTYVLFPDEGHGFSRPANSIAFNAIVERFLSTHLGGLFQSEEVEEALGNTAVLMQH